jgi:DNA polymerase III subunit gamma/tau
MAYLVFARKFRPQNFDELIGQEPITTTLKNAISKNRIAQSFLFTGPRGVGKTSTARIFAKALNCEKGLSAKPCEKCLACQEVTQGTNLDVLEIDGASNRGIDEIRSLRENVKFKPTSGRFKIYIIDEVHMLTGEAFNALLKTLEEPPEHVKFVFATTEVHKVPLTILSRCQRFNFKRIATSEIVTKLKEVAKREKLKASEKVLFLIAKHSEGSLRDAESLLDQLASFGEGKISEVDLQFSLGLTGDDIYESIFKALETRDATAMLRFLANVIDEGKDLTQFTRGLLEWFRDLMVLNVTRKPGTLVEASEDRLQTLQKFEESFSQEELLFSITLIQQLHREMRWSDTPRFLVETCLLKISNRSNLKSIDEILRELKSIEKAGPISVPLKRAPNVQPVQPIAFPVLKKKDNLEGQILGEAKSMFDRAPAQKNKSASSIPTATNSNEKFDETTIDEVGRIWPDLLERVKATKMSCGTFLSEAEPVDVVEGIVVFGFPVEFKFHKEILERQENRELIRTHLAALLGKKAGVSFVVTEPEARVVVKKEEPVLKNSKDLEIITSALDVFQGSHIIRQE